MSSISSISSLASTLFARLDTKSQGYIEKTDLQSAFDKISASSSASSADEVFSSLDSDQDGKITESELSSSLQKLADQIDSQLDGMRMSSAMSAMGEPGGAGGMPPPPPADDEGFTQDELSSQLDEIGSTDSKRSSLISNIVANFDEADTDGNGKVSMQEAMAYDQANSSTSSSGASSTGTTSTENEFAVMLKVMQLAQSYGAFGTNSANQSSSLSVVA
ncbi:EF-hand domain-containing protein [Uliginosibacterium sp. 31-16]|uniref:EF-hand domain-containing protein n=1 Tax=Uliginosibacterium sp. 31-16 TaxID=3068315 RepID=UPI00273D4251|nr:EF-hand domain-containing protein [Uliginosibacterium sp. 31-16]MDP5240194.1 EF-hand domain-containing protein [Uliginosibacterium sp. 31-16]